jgi:hypothetical protein
MTFYKVQQDYRNSSSNPHWVTEEILNEMFNIY